MNRKIKALMLSIFVTSSVILASFINKKTNQEEQVNNGKWVDQEILVEFKKEENKGVRGVNGVVKERVKTKAMEKFGSKGFLIIKVPSVSNAVEALKKNPNVSWVSPNYIINTDQTSYPNDPYYTNGSLWGIKNMKADVVWNVNRGDQKVHIGVIDEGISYQHPDLCGQIWVNPYDPVDGIDNDGNGYIDDINGWDFYNNDNTIFDGADNHGTHVAGTIGASGNNGTGVIGVSPNVTIISAKFLQGSGSLSQAIKAIDYITDLKLRHKINIPATNNSWGGGGYVQGLYDAIERSRKADILFIAAAGNSAIDMDVTPSYPACYSNDNVISVASITSSESLSGFSNYGAKTADIGAPGSGIWSTVSTSGYSSYNGTSMAAPHVAGAVALYKSAYTSATYLQIKSAILSGARPSPSMQGKCSTNGVLDVSSFTATSNPIVMTRGCSILTDVIKPSTPTNVVVTGVSNNSVSLSWTASTDNIGVTGYRAYYKTGTDIWRYQTTSTNSINLGNLQASTLYDFYIVAYDGSKNLSENSQIVSATTNQNPPSINVSLQATPSILSVHLNWNIETTGSINLVVLEFKKGTKGRYTAIQSYTSFPPDSYTHSLSAGTYYYRLFVTNQEGVSTYSTEQVAVVKRK